MTPIFLPRIKNVTNWLKEEKAMLFADDATILLQNKKLDSH